MDVNPDPPAEDDDGTPMQVMSTFDPASDTFVANLTVGQDDAVLLTRDVAYAWVTEVSAAASGAFFDAAIVKQLTTASVPNDAAAAVILQSRQPRTQHAGAIPVLGVIGGVSAFTSEPFLTLSLRGKPMGQWRMSDAADHIDAILKVVDIAEFDNHYYRTLKNLGIDGPTAMQMVAGLFDKQDTDE